MDVHLDRLRNEGVQGGSVGYIRAAFEFGAGRDQEGRTALMQAFFVASGDQFAQVTEAFGFDEQQRAEWDNHTLVGLLSALNFGAEHYESQPVQNSIDSLLTRLPPGLAGEGRRRTAVELIRLSELLWDAAVPIALHFSALLRRHACDLFGSLPDHKDQHERTVQLGWLATIYRQLGLPAEARTTYIHALELGEETLDRGERASIRGRFANLLDDGGNHLEAARQQWIAICDAIGWDGSPPRTDALVDAALATSPPDILVINFANCLERGGEKHAAERVFFWFLANVPVDRMPREMRALSSSLVNRLEPSPRLTS